MPLEAKGEWPLEPIQAGQHAFHRAGSARWAKGLRRFTLGLLPEGYVPCWSVTACTFVHGTYMRSAAHIYADA